MPDKKNNKLPEGTWAVTKEDKEAIVKMGRELTKFVFDYINGLGAKTFHAKIVAGAFQYFMDVQQQKSKLIGDDVVISQVITETYDLGKFVEEPFTEPAPVVIPTKEEKIAALKKEIEVLETPEVEEKKDTDVENASIAPGQEK
jgi:hypothetical protein